MGGRWLEFLTQRETGDRVIGWGVSGRGATAWRPWADGLLARLIDDLNAKGRDAVAPLPKDS